MELSIPEDVFYQKYPRLKREHIQDVFPELSPEEREFIMSGITPQEWEMYLR